MYGPSVVATVRSETRLPQPDATSAQASMAARTMSRGRRRIGAGSYRPVGGIRLQTGDRGAPATVVVLLEDRLQAPHRLVPAAAGPAAHAERLHDAVGRERGLGLRRVLDDGAAGGRDQRPRAVGLVAVELAAAADGDD